MLARSHVALCAAATALVLVACSVDSSLPASPERLMPIEPVGPLASISANESVTDPGPFPITPSVWYSRCPDTQTLTNAQWLSLNNPKTVSIDNPDGASKPMVHFEIPLKDLKFYTYVYKGVTFSDANYRLGREIISNDQHWAIPYEGNVTMRCTGGVYTPSPFNTAVAEYVGALQLIAVWDVRRTNLFDEAPPPPPPACDDPLTILIEEEPDCAPAPPQGAWGSGGIQEVPVQAQVSGAGPILRYMCDVTFWYRWESGGWVFDGVQIHWGTCAWE